MIIILKQVLQYEIMTDRSPDLPTNQPTDQPSDQPTH